MLRLLKNTGIGVGSEKKEVYDSIMLNPCLDVHQK